uniref:Diaminopimelate decarboxylase n=1 Tax=Steinernema glaseri TaxID=37863 RepID=A0A1I7ZIJ4_9BILA
MRPSHKRLRVPILHSFQHDSQSGTSHYNFTGAGCYAVICKKEAMIERPEGVTSSGTIGSMEAVGDETTFSVHRTSCRNEQTRFPALP